MIVKLDPNFARTQKKANNAIVSPSDQQVLLGNPGPIDPQSIGLTPKLSRPKTAQWFSGRLQRLVGRSSEQPQPQDARAPQALQQV